MRNYGKSTLFAACSILFGVPFAASAATSPDEAWSEVVESTLPAAGTARQIVPDEYRVFTLDRARIDALLGAAPREGARRAADSNALLDLPLPDGRYGTFRIVESPIMEPALATKYPQIRTWLGQGVDDPSATVRFDITPKGFHAQVIGRGGTTYIDPYRAGDDAHYVSYRKSDYTNGTRGTCSIDGAPIATDAAIAGAPDVSSGGTLRTYRLAMAATGEYTQFHGGTKVDALSAIVTTMNRVNGIYEREVAVRMVLVANEELILFTDPASDPFANSSGDLAANQTTINAQIGAANYDIGHLVGTGGGGVAGLGVVCGGSKARGLTGSGAPVGDAFDVDYVAHEMGHQFSGNHTFNGSGINCSGGNRNGTTSYEPGSGITIQAYAGICGGDNLQPNSDDYFHRVSLNEILAFTTTGGGSTCGTTVATGNGVPTVATPTAVTIPGRTPFTLTASGSDPDVGDALTYLWEQFDLGNANAEGVLDPTDASGPLFRAFAPESSPSRTFPGWRYILNNANVVPATAPRPGTTTPLWMTGEVLPNVSRVMNFRVTVRDNRAGGGGTNEASTIVTVANTAGPFAVTAPNTNVSLAAGSATTVTWDVANTAAVPVSTANVRITLSTDGGDSFPITLLASTANDGSESVTLPAGVATTQARVRVEAVGNVFFDVSDVNFAITGANTAPGIIVLAPLPTRQGAPTASGVVATVSDGQDAAGSLAVAITGAPPELTVSVSNTGGNVTLTATAACTLVAPTTGSRAYPLELRVTDSGGAVRTAEIVVAVGTNRAPTLGTYAALNLAPNTTRTLAASPLGVDPDGNFSSATVTPSVLPGGGTVAIAPDGTLTFVATPATTLGSTSVRARLQDACGAVEQRDVVVNVSAPAVVVALGGATVTTGNALVEPTECNSLALTVRNDGNVPMTGVSATISTSTPNVTITQNTSGFPDIPPGESRTNSIPYAISTSGALACFSSIALNVSVAYAQSGTPFTASANLPVGQAQGTNYQFASSTGATIPTDGVLVAASQGVEDAAVDLVVPAGFNFSVYGTSVTGGTTLRASTNGNLQLRATGGGADQSNAALPSATAFPAAAPTLFVLWDDWRMLLSDGASAPDAGIYTKLEGTAPNRSWIIEWRGRIRGDGNVGVNNNRAALVLHENSNSFDYIYAASGVGASANGAGSTIGVQAAGTGATFTQFAFNNANLVAGTKLTATIAQAICAPGSGSCASVPGTAVVQSGGTTAVAEGGATDSYTISLDTQPTANVVVTATPDAQLSVAPPALTFTTANWSVPQPITVTAVDDSVVEGPHAGNITHAASGGGYSAVPVATVTATIGDNDALADPLFSNGFE